MKNFKYIIIAGLSLFAISCNTDFLDQAPLDQFASTVVWQDPILMEAYVNDVYWGIPHGFGWIMLACGVDEAHSADIDQGIKARAANQSLISATDMLLWDNNFWSADSYKLRNWGRVYPEIRKCNVFLENCPVDFENADLINRLKGEIYFLRAYYYTSLVSLYGGVPIIQRVYGLNDDFSIARNSVEECFNAIAADCDSAIHYLPVNTPTGRASKGAAMTLKSRALLYAASDFFNDPSWAGSYEHPELIAFANSNRNARWELAKNAAKALIDMNIYSLHKGEPALGDSIPQNYAELFLVNSSSEHIFVKHFVADAVSSMNSFRGGSGWDQYQPGQFNAPSGWHGWGGTCPTGQLVNDFEMADGTKFDWNNPQHAANPYKNRDPRFYATVLYEGAKRSPRPEDVRVADPIGIVQVGYYEVWNNEKGEITLLPGLDTRDGVDGWNGTYTGYYMRKFIDESIDITISTNYQETPWIYMRYAEVLLNYAEACNALEMDDEARWAINQIRKRAGMPPTNLSGESLKDLIRNERKIELAFEDHRFFDVRRWLIAPDAYTDVEGVSVRYPLNADKTTSDIPVIEEVKGIIPRAWNNKYYLLPIKFDELNKNSMLIQNPYY